MKTTLKNRPLNFVRNLGFAALAVLAFGRCASINNLTGAKTQAAGDLELYTGVDYSNLLRKSDGTSTDTKTFGIDFAGRYGLTGDDEIGFKLANSFSYLSGDYKRALIKDGIFYLSSGVGVGYLGYEVTGGTESLKYKQIDMFVPVYMDYYVSPSFGLLFGPKFVYSIVSGEGAENVATAVLSGGFRWGQKAGMHAEFGYGIPFQDGAEGLWQTNVGFFY